MSVAELAKKFSADRRVEGWCTAASDPRVFLQRRAHGHGVEPLNTFPTTPEQITYDNAEADCSSRPQAHAHAFAQAESRS